MLKELTPEQEARLPEFRDKWLKIGLCTDPIDFEKAKAAVSLAYECADLKPPKEFEYFESPESMANTFKERGWEISVANGCHDAGWLARYDTLIAFGVKLDKIKGLIEVAKTCGWWSPHEDYCAIQDRPCKIAMVNERLHNEEGPSVMYRDGFSVWSLNGVRVNEQIVMRPETQTLDQIHQEKNEEVRAIRIERYGWVKYLEDVGAKPINERENPIEYTVEALFHIEHLDINILVCACPSTGKIFSLEVPSEHKTCKDAQNFLSGGRADRIISAS